MIKCWGVTLLTTGWVQLLDKCNVSYLRFFKVVYGKVAAQTKCYPYFR